ncbi:response regulator transcription factor [Streptomyces sioyaensis]|uniref:response regulator transcription factor n=1 Tax=Streptomyces sioyaensis TaxID=67364 RepID=UPI003790692F
MFRAMCDGMLGPRTPPGPAPGGSAVSTMHFLIGVEVRECGVIAAVQPSLPTCRPIQENRTLPLGGPTVTSRGQRHLTRRQEEVLREMLNGGTAQQIAHELNISTATVHTHLRAIYSAFGVSNRVQAVISAIEAGYRRSSEAVQATYGRARIESTLKEAWIPCEIHPAYRPDCAVCVKAETVIYAIKLVQDPWVARRPSPPANVAVSLRGLRTGDLQTASRGPVRNRIQVSPPHPIR